MRVAVLFNRVGADAAPDERDVLAQRDAVAAALAEQGHEPLPIACDLDLRALAERLAAVRPQTAFNLVESLGGRERLLHLVPALLDALGLAYTGAPTEALFLATNKLLAKERLAAAGLPTPAWWTPAGDDGLPAAGDGDAWIVKSVWEHGSVGLTDAALVAGGDRGRLAARVAELATEPGGACFAEAYVEGRELNLSLLDGPSGPRVLPPAEIVFADYPPGKPRIVGYPAKWEPASFEYRHTPRRFDFPAADAPLLAELGELARRAWRLFGLRGYARVDFRVDAGGRPFILEVNANPCLSPDAGFAAALERAGVTFGAAVAAIITEAAVRAPAPGAAGGGGTDPPPAAL
jgi:D-alanine-D-alanine ligase